MTDTQDLHQAFWDRLDSLDAGMLGLSDDRRFIPMSHYTDRDAGKLWFITAKETDLAKSLSGSERDAMHIVCDSGKGLFTRIEGRLSLADDPAKLDELWNAVASSWFEDGRDDSDIQLLRFDLAAAETWITGGSMAFLYQIAKSKATGDKPDLGEHITLNF